MSQIRLDDIRKEFGDVTAVDDVDLVIEDGELLVLVGPSGCGKTTLLRIIAGLEQPTGGTVTIGDRDVTEIPARKRDVALVFQSFALFPHMDVRKNISFNLRMRGGEQNIDERVEDTAELLGIGDLLDRAVDELSGGQQQRVALGRAIVSEPAAFLLDEPLANLDAKLRDQMQTEIVRLQKRLAVTTIHVTHNQREAMTMGDRIAVMRDGTLQQLGPPETVYSEPANLFVARFVGSPTMNFVDGEVLDGAVRLESDEGGMTIGVETGLESGDPVVVGARPEQVDIEPGRRPDEDWLTAEISFMEFHGADTYAYLEPAGLPEVVVRVAADTDLERGDLVSIRFAPGQTHVFHAETGDRIPVSREESTAPTWTDAAE